MHDDRQHPATFAQRQRAHARGDFPVSRELGGTLTAVAGIAAIASLGTAIFEPFRLLAIRAWTVAPQLQDAGWFAENPDSWLRTDGLSALLPVAGLLGLIWLVAVGVFWMQSGFRVQPARLRLDFARLRPSLARVGQGGWHGLAATLVGLARWASLLAMVAMGLWFNRQDLGVILNAPRNTWVAAAGESVLRIVLGMVCGVALWCLVDRRFAAQRMNADCG